MNKLFPAILIICLLAACKNKVTPGKPLASNKVLATLFENYYNGRMALLPVEATINGDNRYNDLLPADLPTATGKN